MRKVKVWLSVVMVFVIIVSLSVVVFASDQSFKGKTITVTNGYGLLAKTGYKVSGLDTEAKIKIDSKIKCLTFDQVVDVVNKSNSYLDTKSYDSIVKGSSYSNKGKGAGLFCGFLSLGCGASEGDSKYFRNVKNKEFTVSSDKDTELLKNVFDMTEQQHHLTGEFTIRQHSLVPSEGSLYLELTRIKTFNAETNETESRTVISTSNVRAEDDEGVKCDLIGGSLVLDGDPLNED
jgi:hypothetical protein